MRTLTALGLAVAMVASWCAPLPAQADESYGGPPSISFESNGAMGPTLSGSVDLAAGTADVVGPCGPGIKAGAPCGPSDRRHVSLSVSDLAKFRSLAIEVEAKGLLDSDCIEAQKKQTQLDDARQQNEIKKKRAAWRKSHPGNKSPVPSFEPIIMPPLDPFFASLTVDGVGSVTSVPEVGNVKSDSRCMAPATKTLWNMVLNAYAQTWPAP